MTIASLLGAALKTTEKVSIQKCVPGRFPDPGWAVAAWVGELSEESAAHLHYTVLQETGAVVADLDREASLHERNGGAQTNLLRLEPADLDGDGVEELVEESEHLRRGWVLGNLGVLRVEGNQLVRKLEVRISYDDGGMVPEAGVTSCKARWILSGTDKLRTLVITSTQASGPNAATECVRGTTQYQLRGGAFQKS